MKNKENFNGHFEAAKITFNKAGGEQALEGKTIKETNENFERATRELWKEFAVSGVLQFNKEKGEQVLMPFTDLDGRSALGILKMSGIDISNLEYVRPGDYKVGAINLDTGDKFGVEYNEDSYTAFFDHHAKGIKEVTSTAEIVYQTMTNLNLLKKSKEMDKLVDFVTKIDNRKYPPEEFLKSGKTILGLQKDLDFEKLLNYFKDHDSPTEELKPEDFEKYDLKESAEKQQKIVDESMVSLDRMEKEGKVVETKYGKILINANNELRTGAASAYVKFDGIINFTPGKSFAVTLKNNSFKEEELRQKLGNKFQGKIIRNQMWIYNESKLLGLSIEEIIDSLVD